MHPDKNVDELDICTERTNNGIVNYANCKLTIYHKPGSSDAVYTYKRFGDIVAMYIDEVLGNCSSVSIHHCKSLCPGHYNGLFESKEEAMLFIKYIVQYLNRLVNFSAVLYTISSESEPALAEYCSKYAQEVYKVKNRRNSHEVTYYCETLLQK